MENVPSNPAEEALKLSPEPRANPWWKPPRLRSFEQTRKERHATWLELFFDLVYVAAISQLSHTLHQHFSISGILQFVLLAIPIWWAWTGTAFYSTRFDTDDLSDRLFYCLQLIGVAALAVNVHDGLGSTSTGFALAYAFIRFLLVLQYLLAGFYVPEARSLAYRYAAGFGLAAICWMLSVLVPMPYRFIIWGMGLLIDFGTPLGIGILHAKVPPDNSHISERYGLFIIVVLGEAIMGAVSGASVRPFWHLPSGITGVCGLLIAFSLWWIYFDHASSAPAKAARDQSKVWLYQTWLYSHLPLMIGLAAMGVSIQEAVLAKQTQPLPDLTRWLLCGGTMLSFLAIGIVHLTSCFYGSRLVLKLWLPYAITISVIGLMGFVQPFSLWPSLWCLILAAICLFNVFIHIFFDRQIQQPSAEEGHPTWNSD